VRLTRKDHHVELAGQLAGQNGRGRAHRAIARRTGNAQPGLSQPRGTCGPDQECDITAGLEQPAAEVPTSRTRPNHKETHGNSSLVTPSKLLTLTVCRPRVVLLAKRRCAGR